MLCGDPIDSEFGFPQIRFAISVHVVWLYSSMRVFSVWSSTDDELATF